MHHPPIEPSLATVRWGMLDATIPPTLTVASGDRITLTTLTGDKLNAPGPGSGFELLPGHRELQENAERGPGPHFVTGPVAVEGANPGDALAVKVLDVQLAVDWGYNVQMPLLGTLPDDFPERRLIHIPIDRARRVARLPWGQELPLAPFFGLMGVAPPRGWGRLSTMPPRAFGGNMDNKELGPGATIYFPVFEPGALFYVGDGHGVQGDGEVCLSAVETCLTGTFELTLVRGMKLVAPRAETAETWITMGFHEDLDVAAREALRDMLRHLGALTGLAPQDAYTLCSLAADLRITQTVNGNKGVHCVIRKDRLPPHRA